MNVELLLKVKEAILAKPESYAQHAYCGTAHCIAGHAVVIAAPAYARSANSDSLPLSAQLSIGRLGKKLLELQFAEGEALCCHPDDWTEPFATAYADAICDPIALARVAAARIDHFIASGGTE